MPITGCSEGGERRSAYRPDWPGISSGAVSIARLSSASLRKITASDLLGTSAWTNGTHQQEKQCIDPHSETLDAGNTARRKTTGRGAAPFQQIAFAYARVDRIDYGRGVST